MEQGVSVLLNTGNNRGQGLDGKLYTPAPTDTHAHIDTHCIPSGLYLAFYLPLSSMAEAARSALTMSG